MPGGLIQLTVTGKQNKVLTGQPTMTYFKYAYNQHTNFACESIAQSFNGSVDFGQKVNATISRNGDLITNMTLEVNLPNINSNNSADTNGDKTIVNWANAIGHRLIEWVSIEVGGQEVDRHRGEWLEINSELTLNESQKKAYHKMVGKREFYFIEDTDQSKTLYIPLQFWFCKESGLALPLVALQHHDVKVHVKFRSLNECVTSHTLKANGEVEENASPQLDVANSQIISSRLLCDFVYLDVCERKWYAQHSHKYLIEQVQYNGLGGVITSSDSKLPLEFNHACKELIWYATLTNKAHKNDWLNFGKTNNSDKYLWGPRDNDDILKTVTLYLNGHERVEERRADYFRVVNALTYHTSNPSNYIYTYSFALHPEKQQPSGALNFSLIDEALLHLKTNVQPGTSYELHAYAKNYNMLIITQGMGGLAFNI
jgi:frataxin-like iron-binding protein CyaY